MNTADPRGGQATVTCLVPHPRTETARAETQGALALDLDLPEPPPPPPETLELDRRLRARRDDEADHLRRWAARLAEATVECAAGQRPTSQLLRWTTPEVYDDLQRRSSAVRAVGAAPSRRTRPQVRSIHLCRPGADAIEVSVHVRHGQRSRALALRLERRQERWICTAAQFG